MPPKGSPGSECPLIVIRGTLSQLGTLYLQLQLVRLRECVAWLLVSNTRLYGAVQQYHTQYMLSVAFGEELVILGIQPIDCTPADTTHAPDDVAVFDDST